MVSAASTEELEELQVIEEQRFYDLWNKVIDETVEQEKFEDWICQNWDEEYHNFEKFDTGAYEDPDVEYTWHGWLEGRNDLFITLERLGLLKYE